MILNENAQKWSSIISESLHIDNQAKLNWMSQYAANHEMFEAVQANGAGINVAGGIYSTPLNTMGMGNPTMPTVADPKASNGMVGLPGGKFGAQNPGSGDIPMSTLTMALEVAAMTIGLELVPVIPASGPWAMLSYMDFPYAGGKIGRINETSLDGKGDGDNNKPIYIKIDTDREIKIAAKALAQGAAIVVAKNGGKTLNATYIGNSRINNEIIVKVVDCGDANTSIADVFDQAELTIKLGDAEAVPMTTAKVDLVAGAADHVQGFANFFDGGKDPMSRAQNETGVGNTIGARMFTRLVQMGAYEVTGSVTRQQLQDMPLYGVDVIGKVLEAMQNEISQHINNRILDRVFTLGVDNAKIQKDYQNVDLNLYFGSALSDSKKLSEFGAAAKMVDSTGKSAKVWGTNWTVPNATQNTAADNTHTHQRRIMSRALAAANLIANVSRFGRGQWLVTNTQVLSALQDCAAFVIAPMANTLTQDGSNSLYFAGTLAGLQVYVDPFMTWEDTRICVGRKSDGNTPGVIFMPYILADSVSITAEGTMAPKLLLNSRYAVVDAGFFPEANYFTFYVYSKEQFV